MFRGAVIGNILCYSKKCPTYFQFHIQRGKILLLKSASLVAYQQSARSTSLEEPGVHCHRLRRLSSGTEVNQLSFLRDHSLFPTQCRQKLKIFTFTFAVDIHHKTKTKSSKANFETLQVESDQLDCQRKKQVGVQILPVLFAMLLESQEDTIVLQAFSKFRSFVNCGGEADNLKNFLSIRHCSMNSCIFIYYQ